MEFKWRGNRLVVGLPDVANDPAGTFNPASVYAPAGLSGSPGQLGVFANSSSSSQQLLQGTLLNLKGADLTYKCHNRQTL